MSVRRWNPPEVPPPFAFYSHLAEAPAGARVVAMSGQVGVRADGSFPESLEEQFEVALANVIAIASAAGKGEADIMKLLVFLTDPPTDFGRVNAAMKAAFPTSWPAVTWIYVKALFRPDVKVEIDVTLAVPGQ